MKKNKQLFKNIPLLVLGATLFIMGYYVPRTDFIFFISVHILAFAAYFLCINQKHSDLKIYLGIAVILRIMLIFSEPNLSDDFFRFAWDGRLLISGINPFHYRPDELISSDYFNQLYFNQLYLNELYFGNPDKDWFYFSGLNSKNYYSVYPSVLQFIFGCSSILSKDLAVQLIIMKLFVVSAEIGTIYFSSKILKIKGIDESYILLYALNPLIIIELSGNIHFEAVAIFFLSGTIYFLYKEKLIVSALLLSAAVASKLIPLISLPLFFSYLGWKKGSYFSLLVIIFSFLMLSPILLDYNTALNLGQSIRLYYKSFEFNAGLYYLIRYLWSFFDPYPKNDISVGFLQITLISFICYLTFFNFNKVKTNFQLYLYLLFLVYLLTTRTVHPWYLSTVIWLSIFTKSRTAVLWSFLVGFTYITYLKGGFTENNIIIFLEYFILFIFGIKEIFYPKLSTNSNLNKAFP